MTTAKETLRKIRQDADNARSNQGRNAGRAITQLSDAVKDLADLVEALLAAQR